MKLDLEQWRDLAQPFYEVIPQEPAENAGVVIQVTPIADLLTTKLDAPGQLLIHDPSLQKGVCHDYLLFERFHFGEGQGRVEDTTFSISTTRLHLIDMSRRFVTSKIRSTSQGVLIPHNAVEYVPGEDCSYSFVDILSPSGRILAVAHEALVSAKNAGSAQETANIAGAFLELISRLMLRREKRGEVTPETGFLTELTIKQFIFRHLDRSDLDAGLVADAFGISRATLYRRFDIGGGVAQFIRNSRLDRCFFELAGTRPEHGTIKSIAERWQFSDASHFNRMFRERFGMSPSACLASADGARRTAPPALTQVSRAWLDQLARMS